MKGKGGRDMTERKEGAGGAGAGGAWDGEDFAGVVKSFNLEKGYGFIRCDATFARYGKDVFLLERRLPAGVVPGSRVSFRVVENRRCGDPQASEVVWLADPEREPEEDHSAPNDEEKPQMLR